MQIQMKVSFFKLVVTLEHGGGGGAGGGGNKPVEPTQIKVDLSQNFRFKFDIAWFVLWSLAQKEVLNLLHIYVVVWHLAHLIPVTEDIFSIYRFACPQQRI